MRTITLKNEEETKAFGVQLGRNAARGDIIALIGDLGTGKTALTKYIAKGLVIEETVTSPTFTIVQEYHSGKLPLYHFDVYRIGDPDEMFELGYEEYFFEDGVCVIEWADLIEDLIPPEAKTILLEYGEKEGERIYRCTF